MALEPGGGGRAWPGLSAQSGRMEMDPDVLRTAAADLRAELESLADQSAGSLPKLSSATSQPAGTSFFGDWDIAREMAEGYRVAQEAVVEAYTQLLEQLGNAVSALEATAGGTEATDELGATGFRDQSAALGDTGGGSGPPVEVREA